MTSSVMNSRILSRACFNLTHPTDHQWLKWWLIHGCKEKLQPKSKCNRNSNKDKWMWINRLTLTEQKKKRKNKEDRLQENKTLLLEVVLLERKLRSVMKLSCNHKKNSLHTKRFSIRTLSSSPHATQIWLKRPLLSTWEEKKRLSQL